MRAYVTDSLLRCLTNLHLICFATLLVLFLIASSLLLVQSFFYLLFLLSPPFTFSYLFSPISYFSFSFFYILLLVQSFFCPLFLFLPFFCLVSFLLIVFPLLDVPILFNLLLSTSHSLPSTYFIFPLVVYLLSSPSFPTLNPFTLPLFSAIFFSILSSAYPFCCVALPSCWLSLPILVPCCLLPYRAPL